MALVMTGGVSLAVWMGGVSAELYRLVKREGVYGDLLALTDTRVTVDITSGSSAGGLNGVFFGAALARDLPTSEFDRLRDLWVTAGSFSKLLRDPMKKDPRHSYVATTSSRVRSTRRQLKVQMCANGPRRSSLQPLPHGAAGPVRQGARRQPGPGAHPRVGDRYVVDGGLGSSARRAREADRRPDEGDVQRIPGQVQRSSRRAARSRAPHRAPSGHEPSASRSHLDRSRPRRGRMPQVGTEALRPVRDRCSTAR